jgi:hypothetical protein
MATEKTKKNELKYVCENCHFVTCKKTDFDRHNTTLKHKNNVLATFSNNEATEKTIIMCNFCDKEYKDRTGLWRHKKKCEFINKDDNKNKNNNLSIEHFETTQLIQHLLKENIEIKTMMMQQQNLVLELCKNGTHNTNTTTTNSHNKTFNLNMFLNETCKNAMNISEFVDSIHLQLSDLEDVGELGYINGISNIIIKNLRELDITQRPIHCTDAKREILYVKDQDKWEKENEQKDKMVGFVKNVANKNIKLLNEFKNNYPDCAKRESRHSDHYNKLVIEAMGGSCNNNYEEKHEKIIKKISKEVIIDKEIL